MTVKKLSIIIPCYNEEKLISSVLEKVLQTTLDHNLEKQIIIVNDGSTDNSAIAITQFCEKNPSAISIHHQINSGKGAAVKAALQKADGHADVVYGSRFMGSGPHRVLFFFHTIGNKFLTFLSNLFTGLNLTDMETGYKMFKADVLKQIHLKENRFGIEPEVTAKASRIKNIRFYEVGIAYYGRTYDDGKKIKWTDGFYAIWCILKYNIFSRK